MNKEQNEILKLMNELEDLNEQQAKVFDKKIIDSDTILCDILENVDFNFSGITQDLFNIYRESKDKETFEKLFFEFTDYSFKDFLEFAKEQIQEDQKNEEHKNNNLTEVEVIRAMNKCSIVNELDKGIQYVLLIDNIPEYLEEQWKNFGKNICLEKELQYPTLEMVGILHEDRTLTDVEFRYYFDDYKYFEMKKEDEEKVKKLFVEYINEHGKELPDAYNEVTQEIMSQSEWLMMNDLMYVLDDELQIDDKDNSIINGYVFATRGLVKKLAKENNLEKLLNNEEIENINFYVLYNTKNDEVKLSSSYWHGDKNVVCELTLEEWEKNKLKNKMEEWCNKKYGMTCLDFCKNS